MCTLCIHDLCQQCEAGARTLGMSAMIVVIQLINGDNRAVGDHAGSIQHCAFSAGIERE